jgi:hypothetical protein
VADGCSGKIQGREKRKAGELSRLMSKPADTNPTRAAILKDLQRIPGIGPRLARDLVDLGIRRVSDLRRSNPEQLYKKLCALRGKQEDRCVLYTFRCAIYFASEPAPDPELLKWWNWQDGNTGPGLSRLS